MSNELEMLLRKEIEKLLVENIEMMEIIEANEKVIAKLRHRIRDLEYLHYGK